MSDKAMTLTANNLVIPQNVAMNQTRNDHLASTLFFAVSTEYGEIGLSMSDQRLGLSSISHIHSRLELSKAERIIRAVEDMIGLSLDFEPISRPPVAPCIANLTISANPFLTISVYLPIPFWWLSAHALFELQKSGVEIDWPVNYAKLSVARLNLTELDLESVKKNSLVLIPESFRSSWEPVLTIAAIGGSLQGTMDSNAMFWQATTRIVEVRGSENNVLSDQNDIGEIFCYSSFSTDSCIGAKETMNDAISTHIQNIGCILQCGDGVRASGMLMPVGNGAGLHINDISNGYFGQNQ